MSDWSLIDTTVHNFRTDQSLIILYLSKNSDYINYVVCQYLHEQDSSCQNLWEKESVKHQREKESSSLMSLTSDLESLSRSSRTHTHPQHCRDPTQCSPPSQTAASTLPFPSLSYQVYRPMQHSYYLERASPLWGIFTYKFVIKKAVVLI